MFRSKEFSEMFQFSGEDLWFLRLLALFYILGKWWNSDMFQMSKSMGKFFVGELQFQVCSSRTICVEQMCLKRIAFVCPTNISISHGMRRGGAKQRRKQYAKVATRDTHGSDPIGIWKLLRSNGYFFFCCLQSLDIAGFCQDAKLWDAQLCDFVAVNQPVIKLEVHM